MALFSFLQGSKPELQLYGKLPIAKDYLRIGLGDGGGVAWRAWLDRCFSTDLERGQPRRLQWPVGYLLGVEKGDPLVGCMWNSTDAGGHRHFPFTLSVHRKRQPLALSLGADITRVLGTWARLQEVRRLALSCANGEELMGELRGKQVPEDVPYHAPQRNVGLPAWCDQLWPTEGRAGLKAAYEQLCAARSATHAPDLRLSLVLGMGWDQQVQAWISMLASSGWLEASNLPNILVQYTGRGQGDGPAAMYVSIRPVATDTALDLCDGARADAGSLLRIGGAPSGIDGEEQDLYPVESSLAQAVLRELGE